MRLRRIEVRDFRKLRGRTVVEGIGDGLTVIAGDNEEGKSSLLAALKAAFFELHTLGGEARRAMSPWGSDAVPEVRIDFEIAGSAWHLAKAFKRGAVRLESAGERREGDAAEQRLQELLRFERPGKGAAKPEHHGLMGMFWVDQGTTSEAVEPVAGNLDRLAHAIEAEVGAAAVGERIRDITRNVETACRRYWTATGRETGPLTHARQELERLLREEQALAAKVAVYEDKTDRLQRLTAQRRQRSALGSVARARERLGEAQARLVGIASLDRRREVAIERAKAAASMAAGIEARLRGREELQAQLVERRAASERCGREQRAVTEALAIAEQVVVAAEAAERAADTALAGAVERQGALLEARRSAEARAELTRLEQAVARALEMVRTIARARADLERDPANARALAEVREADALRREARAALETIATRLMLEPLPGRQARRAEGEVDTGQTLLVTGRTELDLEGFGRIVIVPGAEDLEVRRARLRDAERRLAQALAAIGATDSATAESLAVRRRRTEEQLAAATAALDAQLAAQGARTLEALEKELAAVGARVSGAVGDGQAPDPSMLAEAAGAVALAQAELARSRAGTQRAMQGVATARGDLKAVAGLLARHGEEVLAIEERLSRERAAEPDAMLRQLLEQARSDRAKANAEFAAVEDELRLADAEAIRERVQIADRQLKAEEADQADFTRRLRDLEVELRALGADAAGEQLHEVRDQRLQVETTLTRLRREANAWKLLESELGAASQSLRERWAGPVRERLMPLLSRLLPRALPVVDQDSLSLTHLHRDGRDEPFGHLSFGTREQLSVLVRLAFARLLAEREGEAPCLLLDDALVHTDEGRLDSMKTLLERAGSEVQIILLTCRPRDYLGLNAQWLRLEDCRDVQ